MSERIHTFSERVRYRQEREYRVHVDGEERSDGTWVGWLAFEPLDGTSPTLRTERETTQPNRRDLEYWATGVELVYLEGALERALRAATAAPAAAVPPPAATATPAPAPPVPPNASADMSASVPARAVLDPFAVFVQGEDVLREELGALDAGHLRNIVRAYRLADEAALRVDDLERARLMEVILAAVRRRAETV